MSILLVCYQTLNTYGRDANSLRSIGNVFSIALEDYSLQQIESAFNGHIKQSADFPTPFDIIKIIKSKPQRAGVKTL